MSTTLHDALFRTTFSHPERAMDLLRVVYPSEILAGLDPSSMCLLSGSYLDDELRSTHSDLLFSVRSEGHETLVYLLFEHQSTNDALMPLRMQQYMSRVWMRWVAEHPDEVFLPVVLSAVVSHAPEGWRSPVRFSMLHKLSSNEREKYGTRLLDFEMTVLDLTRWEDESIRLAPITPLSKLVFLALKYGRMARKFRSRVRMWLELLKQTLASPVAREEVDPVLLYLLVAGLEQKYRLLETVRITGIGEEVEEVIVTSGEQLIEEGRQRGLRQGLEQGERALLRRMLSRRFGPLPQAIEERIDSASSAFIDAVSTRLLTASSLEELFE